MTELEKIVKELCTSIDSMTIKMEQSIKEEIELYVNIEQLLKTI